VIEWRPAPGYEGYYAVSSLGDIQRIKGGPGVRAGRIIRPASGSGTHKYLTVTLRRDGQKKTHLVHLLVARAFLGPPPAGQEVNHIDGNGLNPVLSNLEYISHSGNVSHAYRIGNKTPSVFIRKRGEAWSTAKLTDAAVIKIRRGGRTDASWARELGVSDVLISRVRRGLAWSHVTSETQIKGDAR
jgi:hypothetical protein